MRKKGFYKGNFQNDAQRGGHHGWFIGSFMPGSVRNTKDLEIKFWSFKKGPTRHDMKISNTIECTLILSGTIMGTIGKQTINLRKGDYVVIRPGIRNNLAKIVTVSAQGLTIKAPSDPSAKKVIR